MPPAIKLYEKQKIYLVRYEDDNSRILGVYDNYQAAKACESFFNKTFFGYVHYVFITELEIEDHFSI